MKKLLWVLLILLIIGGNAGAWWYFRAEPVDKKEDVLKVSGRVEVQEVAVSSVAGGRLIELNSSEGDQVNRDAVVARIDDSLLAAQIKQAEAAVEVAEAAVRVLPARAPDAQKEMAEAQVKQAKAAVDVLKAQRDLLTLKAPISGLVLRKVFSPGETVMPGAPVLVLGNLDEVKVTVYVPEDKYGKIRLGQEAVVKVDSYEDREFTGRVEYISSRAEFTPKNVETKADRVDTVYAVRIKLLNRDRALKPGMPADVEVRVD